MLTIELSDTELNELDGRLEGDLFRAGDAEWDRVRGVFNLTVEQTPVCVVEPESAADVSKAVAFAAARGLRVAPQGTGHNPSPLGDLSGSILIRTRRLDEVRIDAEGMRCRAGAGVRWGDVVPAASELGLACLHGSSPDVGVVGYHLGGGLGWYARKHGLAANSVVAVELVDRDGIIRRVDADSDPELFWAVRGGGGNFGVITAIEFRLFPIAEVYAGALFVEAERAAEVFKAWHGWTRELPEEVTSVARVLQFPPLDAVPEPLRGRTFAIVEATVIGDAAAGAELIAPLRELGPGMDTFGMVPPAGIAELHMDPRDPVPCLSDSQVLADLSPELIDRMLDAAGPLAGTPLMSLEVRHLGGALGRAEAGSGAIASMPGEYLTFAVGAVFAPEMAEHLSERFGRVSAALAAVDCGRYLNFVESPLDSRRMFDPMTVDRLARARAAYDPERTFHANHEIEPVAG